jgi:Phasin protein
MASTSETRRPHEAAREPEASVRRAGQAAEEGAAEARAVGASGIAAAARTTDAAVGIARRLTEQGREAMGMGLRAAAEANVPLTDAGYVEGRRLLDDTTRIANLYREASEDTAADVQALVASAAQLGRGLQRMQDAYLDVLQRALGRAKRQPHDLLRCRSAVEFAEVQRDLYVDGVTTALEMNAALLHLACQVAQDAAAPLEGRRAAHSRA